MPKASPVRIETANANNNTPGLRAISLSRGSSDANREGALRTATIKVTTPQTLISSTTKGLADLTKGVAILYGGAQSYDPVTQTMSLDIVLKNNSGQSLQGPFKLTVPDLNKQYGFAEIQNADNNVTAAGAVWDVTGSVPGGLLVPGGTSKPFTLKFRYMAKPDQE
jgi:hypothetical protein